MKTATPKSNDIVAKETARNWSHWSRTRDSREAFIGNLIILLAIIGVIIRAITFQP